MAPHDADSPASSLGPSNSASQQLRADSHLKTDPQAQANAQLFEELMSHVELLLIHPHFVPEAMLWDNDDCENDSLGEIILMAANKS
jgi:hypothetical protein